MTEQARFCQYAREQVGCLYVLGSQGQEMTPALIRKLEHVTENDFQRALSSYEKHVKAGLTLVAYDCSGLIVKYLLEKGLIKSDYTANGIYFNLCDPISKAELQEGDLVFKKYASQNKMYHVGVYLGDGTVAEAKGRDDGVVITKLSAGGWNRFGRLRCLPRAEVVITRVLKKNCKGADVYALELRLEELGYYCGITSKEKSTGIGNWGSMCEKAFRTWQAKHPECGRLVRGKWVPDGKCGEKSVKALGFVWRG